MQHHQTRRTGPPSRVQSGPPVKLKKQKNAIDAATHLSLYCQRGGRAGLSTICIELFTFTDVHLVKYR